MPKGNENGVQRKRKSSQKCPIKVPPMPQNLERSHTPHLGRPLLEDAYLQLHQAIFELATAGAGGDFRRRTDVLNAC